MTDILLVSLYLPGLNYTYRGGIAKGYGAAKQFTSFAIVTLVHEEKISPGNTINVNSPYACIEAVVPSWFIACLNVYLFEAIDLNTRLSIWHL
jgi:hypothetical protein